MKKVSRSEAAVVMATTAGIDTELGAVLLLNHGVPAYARAVLLLLILMATFSAGAAFGRSQ